MTDLPPFMRNIIRSEIEREIIIQEQEELQNAILMSIEEH